MARRVFFSFHYKNVWQVNQIRNMPSVIGTSAAGFQDSSLWENTKRSGDLAVKRLINNGLNNTSVTVVFVTYGTGTRKFINYEIDQSLTRGNGLVAVQIHHLRDQFNQTRSAGAIPTKITSNGFKAYKYTNKDALARWIEEAARIAGR